MALDEAAMAAAFTLTYDGPALRNSEMNVRDLAPAMLAVGETFEALNALFNDGETQVAVHVRALDAGSFNIVFDVVQGYKHARDLFAGADATAVVNMLELLFGGSVGVVGGLVWLIRKLRGGQPDRIEELSPGLFRILINGETYDVPIALLRAYQELRVRQAIEGFVARPLAQPGITDLIVETKGRELAHIDSDEAYLFRAPEMDENVIVDEVRRAAYTIRQVSFDEDGSWRLFDGNNPIRAKLEDERFLHLIERDEIRFAKHDVLVCNVRVIQRQSARGVKNEYRVLEVLSYIPAPRQLPLSGLEPAR